MDVVKDPDNTITETFTHLVEKHQKTLLHISYPHGVLQALSGVCGRDDEPH